ncbi:CBS domain-containing protein [Azohydromonas caseinilytica]|uniref:CBS domain-containing protein n=1 Tax=Azohydromonas caseinilytica TaxID=2728836 RepID=A0A848F6K8_9BURK|nr:CBS domain-containing protein [Azohydromonas caseinilytica]NML14798.1 CBS domain-containing protein [Azohydromonas caseinilytica]
MTTALEIFKSKPSQEVISVGPHTTVFETVKLMADKNIGAVLVMEGDAVVGIFSERDYARKIVLQERASQSTPVNQVMTPNVMFAGPHQTAEECMAVMTQNRLRHLPVMENGKLLGLISIGDLVKHIISDQQFLIEQLEHYITGHRIEI